MARRISIHVPREGDDDHQSLLTTTHPISIHVPREGDDPARPHRPPTPGISIHVPREGDDQRQRANLQKRQNFYPRPPRGGRPLVRTAAAACRKFLSTSPARGTTIPACANSLPLSISIHVPREGDDDKRRYRSNNLIEFLSTSPARGTTVCNAIFLLIQPFLSTSPARGTTRPLRPTPGIC